MLTFSIVAEGITDQAVLETIINCICQGMVDDVFVNFEQPVRDATDQSRCGSQGGWEKVFEYCSIGERIQGALEHNDFLVIHIDTDCAGHENFDVALTTGGVDRAVAEIVKDVIACIAKHVGVLYEEFEDRIIFAIAVHSTECWLLPLHGKTVAGKKRIKSCEDHLRRELRRKSCAYAKDHRTYKIISDGYKRRKNLDAACGHNESLMMFVAAVDEKIAASGSEPLPASDC
ncbi:MAG: hypothetical protein U1E20_11110 [Methylocystis sp.]|uniref:hypothetical protein n=1 Tax=Methylocystis sp. TaxID=1911079 RepID=UPI003950CE87